MVRRAGRAHSPAHRSPGREQDDRRDEEPQALLYDQVLAFHSLEAAPLRPHGLYVELLERLFRRRWVFDPEPLNLPAGFGGGLYRGPSTG